MSKKKMMDWYTMDDHRPTIIIIFGVCVCIRKQKHLATHSIYIANMQLPLLFAQVLCEEIRPSRLIEFEWDAETKLERRRRRRQNVLLSRRSFRSSRNIAILTHFRTSVIIPSSSGRYLLLPDRDGSRHLNHLLSWSGQRGIGRYKGTGG